MLAAWWLACRLRAELRVLYSFRCAGWFHDRERLVDAGRVSTEVGYQVIDDNPMWPGMAACDGEPSSRRASGPSVTARVLARTGRR